MPSSFMDEIERFRNSGIEELNRCACLEYITYYYQEIPKFAIPKRLSWELNYKFSPRRGIVFCPDGPVVVFYNGAYNGQSETHAAFLR